MRAKRRGTRFDRSFSASFLSQVTLRDVSGERIAASFDVEIPPAIETTRNGISRISEVEIKKKSWIDNWGQHFSVRFFIRVICLTLDNRRDKTPPRSTRVGGTGCWSKCAYRDWPAMTKRVVLVATRGYWFFDTIRQLRGGAVAAPVLVVHRHICFPQAGQRRLRKADFLRFVTDRRVILPLRKYRLEDLRRSKPPRDHLCVFRERKLREKCGLRALKQPLDARFGDGFALATEHA